MKLSEQSLNLLADRILKFESATKGEIRLALLKSSDPYPGANYRLAFFFSFLLSGVALKFIFITGEHLFVLLFLSLTGFFSLAQFLPFRSLFILPNEKNREVKEKAYEIFHTYGLANTENRIGILLFISMLERKIELIVDQAILEKLGQKTLDEIVQNISVKFKKSQYEIGLLDALDFLEKELLQAFPNGLQDKNLSELSNKIIFG